MNLGSMLLGGLGMYLYLRSRGIVPQPQFVEWENRLKVLLAQAGIPVTTTEIAPKLEEEPAEKVEEKAEIAPGFRIPAMTGLPTWVRRPEVEKPVLITPVPVTPSVVPTEVVLIPKKRLKVPPIDCP